MIDKVKIGVIGLGRRGSALLYVLLAFDDVEVAACCDTYLDRAKDNAKIVFEKKKNIPFVTTDYKEVLNMKEIDAVLISTAWEYHAEIAIAAMENKKIVALEVGGAYTIQDCWDLVKTYERTKTPFMFMENCCYAKSELLVTAMARKGKFGKIVHCSGAYAHDLRKEITFGKENRHYRLRNYISRNCENYPTHALGPIAKLLDINRGNRMVSLVSVASKAEGLHQFILENKEKVEPSLLTQRFSQGDIVYTIITCADGETITLKLDTTLPRYYAREFTVRGTKGLYEQNANMVFIEGEQEEEYWEAVDTYQKHINNAKNYEQEFLPDMWKNIKEEDIKAGHGGTDVFTFKAFINAIKNNEEMPIDIYDAVSWMSITCLSEESIAHGGAPIAIPDFTCGKWLTRPRKDVINFN